VVLDQQSRKYLCKNEADHKAATEMIKEKKSYFTRRKMTICLENGSKKT
jgi:hypothetical protein